MIITSNLSYQEITERLQSIIEINTNDSFVTHLKYIVLRENNGLNTGQLKRKSFKFWIHDFYSTGPFYPVFHADIRGLTRGYEISLKHKMNIAGLFLFLLIYIPLAYVLLTEIIIQENNQLHFLVRRTLVASFLYLLFMTFPLFTYFRTLKLTRNYLLEQLDFNEEKNAR